MNVNKSINRMMMLEHQIGDEDCRKHTNKVG